MPDVEVLFLSAAEIVTQLAGGGVHLGITGEDLVREALPDADSAVELLAPLGFGTANVVVAVPQAWIDVRGMADLDEVAAEFRARHGRKLRVATKYVNLTRRFFAEAGVADYRIVESLGATEGAPASGGRGAHRRHHHHRRDARRQRAEGARRRRDPALGGEPRRLAARRPGASGRGPPPPPCWRGSRPRRRPGSPARSARSLDSGAPARSRRARAGASTPPCPSARAEATSTLHVPAEAVFGLVDALLRSGAREVAVRTLDYVFRRENPLAERLFARLP